MLMATKLEMSRYKGLRLRCLARKRNPRIAFLKCTSDAGDAKVTQDGDNVIKAWGNRLARSK